MLMARQPKAQRAVIGLPCFRVSCLEHILKPRGHDGLIYLLHGVLRLLANQLQAEVEVFPN